MVVGGSGETLRVIAGGPTNPHLVGFDVAGRRLRQLLQKAALLQFSVAHRATAVGRAEPVYEAVFLGIAGLKGEGDCERLRDALDAGSLARRMGFGEDARSAWAGALGGEPGIAIVCGTGSKAYGVTPRGKVVAVGGFGYLLGDEGSGTWIGLRALQWVCHATQERAAKTCLTAKILQRLGEESVEGLVAWVYSTRRKSRDFATLCPVVMDAAQGGDAVALDIVNDAAESLARLIAVARRSFPAHKGVCVSYQGGVFEAGETILKPLQASLRRHAPGIALEPPRFSVVEGSVLIAMKLGGVRAPASVLSGYLMNP